MPQELVAPSSPLVELVKPLLRKRHSLSVVGVGVAAALLVAALIAWNFAGWRQWLSSRLSTSPPIQSIAVLPLLNLSSDPDQQFFADGMTDELITNLAQIGSLRVISHTSAMAYSGTHKSAPHCPRIGRRRARQGFGGPVGQQGAHHCSADPCCLRSTFVGPHLRPGIERCANCARRSGPRNRRQHLSSSHPTGAGPLPLPSHEPGDRTPLFQRLLFLEQA